MKPSIIYLEWVNRNWKKERTCLDGCFLLVLVMSGTDADVHTHTRTSDSLTNTHTNISQILSQTLSLDILHALFLQPLNGIILLLLLFTKYFHSQSKCGLCSLWTFSVFMKQLDEPKINRLQPEHSVWIVWYPTMEYAWFPFLMWWLCLISLTQMS